MGEYSDRELEQLLALDGAAGPAQPIDPARSASIIATALHSAGFPPAGASGNSPGSHGAGGASLAPKLTVLAGGAVVVAVVAWLAVRAPDKLDSASPPPAAAAIAPAVTAVAPAPAPVLLIEPAPSEPASSEPATAEPPRAHVPQRSPAPSKLHATATPSHRRRLPAHAAPVVAAVADPEDLLAEANAARLARDWRGADALYTRVASVGGAALAAQTALVASAQLHLEHLGDPDGAARRFRRALTAGARETLAEEARWGLADVARATGDREAERRALDDFLAHHAASVRAAQARARRAELEATP